MIMAYGMQKEKWIGIFLAVLSIMAGTIFPIFMSEIAKNEMFNPLWSPLYSLVIYLWTLIFGDPGFGAMGLLYAVIGVMIWPIFVGALIAWLLIEYVFNIQSSSRLKYIIVFLISICVYVPVSWIEYDKHSILPIFGRLV